MKTLTFTLITLMSFAAFAIENSTYSIRHQAAIKEAVKEKCSFKEVALELLEFTQRPDRIDQGILNYNYVTTLKAYHKLDRYVVTVESHYFDQYDHDARDWGTYLVSSVNCGELK